MTLAAPASCHMLAGESTTFKKKNQFKPLNRRAWHPLAGTARLQMYKVDFALLELRLGATSLHWSRGAADRSCSAYKNFVLGPAPG